jgi:hypothetical protein
LFASFYSNIEPGLECESFNPALPLEERLRQRKATVGGDIAMCDFNLPQELSATVKLVMGVGFVAC